MSQYLSYKQKGLALSTPVLGSKQINNQFMFQHANNNGYNKGVYSNLVMTNIDISYARGILTSL